MVSPVIVTDAEGDFRFTCFCAGSWRCICTIKRFSVFVLSMCILYILGVVCYADGSSISVHNSNNSNRDSSNSSLDEATPTDIKNNVESIDSIVSSDIINIKSDKVILQNDEETSISFGSSLSKSAKPSGYYIDIQANTIGSVLYVPSDYINNSFYIDNNGYLHGCRSSTFQCYTDQYTIRFPSYSLPQYRLTNSPQSSWSDIAISYISSPNVNVLGGHIDFTSDKFRNSLLTILVCFLVIIMFRRSK